MDLINDTSSWSLLLGIVMPYLVAVVNRPWWSGKVRRAVAIAASIVGGLLVCLATGAFTTGDGSTILGACLLVLISSQTVYAHLLRSSAKKVEEATSSRKSLTPTDEPADPPRETFAGYDDEPGQHSEERHAQ